MLEFDPLYVVNGNSPDDEIGLDTPSEVLINQHVLVGS